MNKSAIHTEDTYKHIEDTYKSIAAPSKGLYKDNGSRFISFAYPVTTEDEVKTIVAGLKKEYYDATHHCFAYRLGYKGDVFRAVDDGEPSSSASRPILGQIVSAGLSDILVVVVRYFGGIKLGIPGLIKAYKTASLDVLSNSKLINKTATVKYRISFGYMDMNGVMKILKDLDLNPENGNYGMSCSLDTAVRLTLENTFVERIGKIATVQVIQ